MLSNFISAFQVSLFIFGVSARHLRLRAVFTLLNPASSIRAYVRIYKLMALSVKCVKPG